jgi:hypothetical protein
MSKITDEKTFIVEYGYGPAVQLRAVEANTNGPGGDLVFLDDEGEEVARFRYWHSYRTQS